VATDAPVADRPAPSAPVPPADHRFGAPGAVRRAVRRMRAPALVVPRISAGVIGAARRPAGGELPTIRPSLRSVAELTVDELLLAAQAVAGAPAGPADIRALLAPAEVAAAALAHVEPGDLHPSLEPIDVDVVADRWWRHRFELLTYTVPIRLPDALASGSPWAVDPDARTVHVRLLRHDEPRPWVIVLHGAQQGSEVDLLLLKAIHLHRDLGLNVALPVLPLHGPRRSDAFSVPGLDVVANVTHAIVAVAEIRSLRRWIGHESSLPVGLLGISLGGYLAALTAGIEQELDVVVAGIPVVHPHRLLARHAARMGGRDGRRLAAALQSEAVLALDRFVDPARFRPSTPVEHLHVLGGSLDRVTTPGEALHLADHWGVEGVRWYPGGHVGHVWSKQLRADIGAALRPLAAEG
jgi:hypothetical protein